MRSVLLLIVIVGGLYAAPTFVENAAGQCEAVVRLAARQDPTSVDMPPAIENVAIGIGTLIVLHAAQQKFRAIPGSVTCAGEYWLLSMDPGRAKEIIGPAPLTASEYLRMTPPHN